MTDSMPRAPITLGAQAWLFHRMLEVLFEFLSMGGSRRETNNDGSLIGCQSCWQERHFQVDLTTGFQMCLMHLCYRCEHTSLILQSSGQIFTGLEYFTDTNGRCVLDLWFCRISSGNNF